MEALTHRIDWAKQHILKISNEPDCRDEMSGEDVKLLREKIEPWLTAVFQSEHLAEGLHGSNLRFHLSTIQLTERGGLK